MYYVSMVDSFMSGWGMAKDKKNVLIFVCLTPQEAKAIIAYAKTRPEMKSIKYHGKDKPKFSSLTNFVELKNRKIYPTWYEKGEKLMQPYKYTVIMSFPGCLPENDPDIFDTLQEAKAYLREVKKEWSYDEKYKIITPLKDITKSELIHVMPYELIYIETDRNYRASIAMVAESDLDHEV